MVFWKILVASTAISTVAHSTTRRVLEWMRNLAAMNQGSYARINN